MVIFPAMMLGAYFLPIFYPVSKEGYQLVVSQQKMATKTLKAIA
jgi:hypothetical protein